MVGVYSPRHPEKAVLYRVLFRHFDRFLSEYESCFEQEYGFSRPIVKEVVEKYLDCGNPRCGFARVRCPDCAEERLVMFSCRTRGFCPSCHAKRIIVSYGGTWKREIDLEKGVKCLTMNALLRCSGCGDSYTVSFCLPEVPPPGH